jgi:hypothetical protein
MSWLLEYAGAGAALLDVIVLVVIGLAAKYAPRAKRAIAEAVADQVGVEVAKQIEPVRKDLAELRQVFDGAGVVVGAVTRDTTARLELTLVDPNATPSRN